jgi:hypothetical protein
MCTTQGWPEDSPLEDGNVIQLDLIMTSNNSLAVWLGFPVSTALTACLSGRVLFSMAGARAANRKAR